MADKVLPQEVADAFMEQYYVILNKCPENLHKFYQESSSLGWPGSDGVVTPVTTLSGINDKVMSSDYKNWSVETKTVDAQESLEGGVMVVVTGLLVKSDNVKKNFSQTFLLAKQEKGFFVLNDILRFFDLCVPTTHSAVKDDDKNDLAASVPCNSSDISATKAEAVDKGNVKEAFDLSDSKDTDTKAAASTSSIASDDKACPVLAPASNVKDEPKKISYASMVAKTSPVTSPKTVRIPSKAANQVAAPSMTMSSAPQGNFASKALTPSSAVPKSPGPPSNVAPKLPTSGNGPANTHAYGGGARGIYIGNLPTDITKQGVSEVIKQFGLIRRSSDSIQIRKHEDGFCCGFVEFESADAARRAVEVHHVKFGEKEAYITYKKSSYNRGNDSRGKSPSRGGFRNGNFRGRENGVTNEGRSPTRGGARGPRRSKELDHWPEEDGEPTASSN